nr:hypothetical protein Iba_chr12eCG4380 [Ipomoea batatas]
MEESTLIVPESPSCWLSSRNIRTLEPENDPGSDPVKLLKDNITFSSFGKESKKSGMIPKTLALLALKETKLALRFRCVGIFQELRFGFSETLKLFKRGRPERKSEGTELKLLPSKRRSSSIGMLAKEGKGPEREFPETERFMREESCVIPEKSWPEMESESILMEMTLLSSSQVTWVQEQ